MVEVFPNYYEKFRCIADRCKHSCCKGWEIEIDEDTMDLYSSLEGELGDKIRSCIEGEVPHFKLDEDERCPFLNKNGLCDIISEYGDGAICDICYLHPRFTNFYENFEETGLGLCCEEAARIVLSFEEKVDIRPPYELATDEEKAFLDERQGVFDIFQDRNLTIKARFEKLSEKYGINFDFDGEYVYNIYKDLERLDEKWSCMLEKIKASEFDGRIFEKFAVYVEQIACYFIFRHFKMGISYKNSVRFAILSCYVMSVLWADADDFETIADIVRMYSSEIEYSEDNIEKLLS